MAPSTPTNPMAPVGLDQPHGAPLTSTKPYTPLISPLTPMAPTARGLDNLTPTWPSPGATWGPQSRGGGGSRSFWQGPGDAVGTGPSTGSSTDSSPPLCCPPQRPPHAGADGPGAVQGRDCFTGKGWERSRDHPSPAKQPSPRRGGVRPGAPNTAAHGLGKLLVPSRALLRFPLIAS